MKIGETVAKVEARLERAAVDTPRLDAQMLVAHALGVERAFVLAHADDEFRSDALEPLVARREAREPLAYILGWREFYGRRFAVSPEVLIPRQETETLVEVALKQDFVRTVLDVGTGSGCIALTLALERPEWDVTAVDLSPGAIEVAQANALSLLGEGSGSVRFVLSDLFGSLDGEPFDLIVSNPPYVAAGDALDPEIARYEPSVALYAASGGLDLYRRIAEESAPFLRATGALIVEVGDHQALRVAQVFEEAGWHVDAIVRDLAGTPRVLVLKPLFVERMAS